MSYFLGSALACFPRIVFSPSEYGFREATQGSPFSFVRPAPVQTPRFIYRQGDLLFHLSHPCRVMAGPGRAGLDFIRLDTFRYLLPRLMKMMPPSFVFPRDVRGRWCHTTCQPSSLIKPFSDLFSGNIFTRLKWQLSLRRVDGGPEKLSERVVPLNRLRTLVSTYNDGNIPLR